MSDWSASVRRYGVSPADLVAARQREPAAVTRVYTAYAPALFRFFMAAVGDRQEAMDLTGGAFVSAIEGLPGFRGPVEGLGGWLFRIARNELYDFRRRQARTPGLAPLDEYLDEAAKAAGADDPEELAIERLEGSRVMAALQQLSEDQREVLLLRMAAGLTEPEVAAALNKTTGAVKSLQHRGLVSLARLLGLRGVEEERWRVRTRVQHVFDAVPAYAGSPGPRVTALLESGLEANDERSMGRKPSTAKAGISNERDQVKLHFYAEIEREIVVNDVSTVTLIVSRKEIYRLRRPNVSTDEAEASVDWPLTLEAIVRRNVEIVGRSRIEMTVPATDTPGLVLFDVRGTHVGDGEVWITGRQGQIPLVTLVLKTQIVAHPAPLPAQSVIR